LLNKPDYLQKDNQSGYLRRERSFLDGEKGRGHKRKEKGGSWGAGNVKLKKKGELNDGANKALLSSPKGKTKRCH